MSNGERKHNNWREEDAIFSYLYSQDKHDSTVTNSSPYVQ